MTFSLQRDRTVQQNIRHIASSQLRGALDSIDSAELDVDRTVHEVRKTCKKVRGLLRLTRGVAVKLYERENAALRDTARRLSDLRDLTANLESLELLENRFGDSLQEDLLVRVRRALEKRRAARAADPDSASRIERARGEIEAALARTRAWEIPGAGFEALEGGLRKTYGRAVNRMHDAFDEPSSEAWHEWRKRVKYHRYHTDLLRHLWSPVLGEREDQLHDLSDLLGDDNDLRELRQVLREEPEWLDDEDTASLVIGLVDRLRAELQDSTRPLALRLFAEGPDELVARYRGYWQAWHSEPGEVQEADPVIHPDG
ncbi:MAG: CHAD domain-containing protein [Gemmatimonadales bacterium]|nr:MAG: CHAD domain-containing protein [Gemmatimonadales bacterium]